MSEAESTEHGSGYGPSAAPINERGRAYDPDAPEDERNWALYMHLSMLIHIIVPVIGIVLPIVLWLNRKDQSPFIDDHGREAINFQISLMIYSIALPILAAIIGILTCGLGWILMIPASIGPYALGVVGMILACSASTRGEFYRYPMTMRFIH